MFLVMFFKNKDIGAGTRFWNTNGDEIEMYLSDMNSVCWVLKSTKLRML
jgi:hypothetical protein